MCSVQSVSYSLTVQTGLHFVKVKSPMGEISVFQFPIMQDNGNQDFFKMSVASDIELNVNQTDPTQQMRFSFAWRKIFLTTTKTKDKILLE
jgi:hypothetical protein